MSRPRRRIARVLVAIDASPASLAAADSAARIASLLDAELVGLFVEDRALLRLSESPLARQVSSYGGRSSATAGSDAVGRQLRAQASRSRFALAHLAGRQSVAWSFRVVRGEVAEEILAASTDTDVVSLGRFGWALREGRQLGRTAKRLLERRDRLTLFVARHLQPGRSVVVVHDGGDTGRDALELAIRLVGERPDRLSILTSSTAESAVRQEIEAALGDAGQRARITTEELDPQTIERHVKRETASVLLLPAAAIPENEDARTLLTALDCPVLVVS